MQQRDEWSERSRARNPDDSVKLELGLLSPHAAKTSSFHSSTFVSKLLSLRRLTLLFFRTRLGLQLLTVVVCLSWMTASSWAILVNKHIMVNLKFPYPCTIAWMGLLTTTLASYTALRLGPLMRRLAGLEAPGGASGIVISILPPNSPRTSTFSPPRASSTASAGAITMLPPADANSSNGGGYSLTPRSFLTRVLPTGFFMALTFQSGNTGYLYLTVAFVQMLKAFCPVVTMMLLFVVRLEPASRRLVVAVSLIAVGVALASYGELNMSLIGLAAMLTSVVAESIRLVMTQYLLVEGGGGSSMKPLEGLFYISLACTAVLTVQASYLEWPRLLRQGHHLAMALYPYKFAAAACCGFLVNMLAILVIKLASSLTLKVLGTVKDAALVSISIVFLHEQVTALQLVGYGISMVGFISYNMIKAAQHQHQQQPLGGGGVAVGGGALRSLLPYYVKDANAVSSKTR